MKAFRENNAPTGGAVGLMSLGFSVELYLKCLIAHYRLEDVLRVHPAQELGGPGGHPNGTYGFELTMRELGETGAFPFPSRAAADMAHKALITALEKV